MTTEQKTQALALTSAGQGEDRAASAAHRLACWLDLRRLPLRTLAERNEVAGLIQEALTPAGRNWSLVRVAHLLTVAYPHFGEINQGQARLEAEDWADALSALPGWAVERAMRWWRGANNDKRSRRPQPGDIVARAWAEIGSVTGPAQQAVKRFDGRDEPSRLEVRPTAAQADEILKSAGFRLRRMQ